MSNFLLCKKDIVELTLQILENDNLSRRILYN